MKDDVRTEAQPAHKIDMKTIVETVTPDLGYEITYPARSIHERSFILYDEDEYRQDQIT